MKRGIHDTNEVKCEDGDTRVAVSLDIVDMYPSLEKGKMKELVYKLVRLSKVKTDNFDWKSAMVYISKHVDN